MADPERSEPEAPAPDAQAMEREADMFGRFGRALGVGCALSAFVPSLVKPGVDVGLVSNIAFFVPVGVAIFVGGTVLERRKRRDAEAARAAERARRKAAMAAREDDVRREDDAR